MLSITNRYETHVEIIDIQTRKQDNGEALEESGYSLTGMDNFCILVGDVCVCIPRKCLNSAPNINK